MAEHAVNVAVAKGNNNTQTQNNITVNVHPNLVYVGSEAERAALFEVFQDPANLRELATLEPEEIPAALFRMWKGGDAPAELKNIRVLGNKVEEKRGPNNVVSVPRAKFVRRTVGDMVDAAVKAPSSKVSQTLTSKDFKVGKKQRASRHDAAVMHSAGSRDVYALDADGRQFLDDSKRLMDRELDYYAADC